MSNRKSRRADPPLPPPPTIATPKRSGLPLLLAALILLAYGRLFVCQFVNWDDGMNLYQNPRLNPPTLAGVGAYWREPWVGASGLYIPVTYTIWGLLAWGTWVPTADEVNNHLDPRVFHGANVTAHVIAACLVFGLMNRLLRRPWAAFVGAAFFALHPLQVESVGWVSGLKDVLCGLFSVAALVQYVASAQRDVTPASSPPVARQSIGWRYVLGSLAFATAMLCKPTAIVTPALAFVLDVWVVRRPPGRVLRWVAPWVVLAVPFLSVARQVQNVLGVPNAPVSLRPLVAGDTLAFYLWKIIATYPLVFDYNLTPDVVLQKLAGRVGWVVPVALSVIAWRYRRRLPVVWAALLLFVIPLLPNSGLATFQYLIYSVVADHYVYLSLLGPAFLVAWLADRFHGHRTFQLACAAALAVLGIRTAFQCRVWQDNFTLTAYSISHNPYGYVAHGNLGSSFDDRSKLSVIDARIAETEGRADQARESLTRAAEDARRAREQYEIAQRLRPEGVVPLVNLISLDLRFGMHSAAYRDGNRLVQLIRSNPLRATPDVIPALERLSAEAFNGGRYGDAISFLDEAVALDPFEPRLRAERSELDTRVAALKNRPATTRAATQ